MRTLRRPVLVSIAAMLPAAALTCNCVAAGVAKNVPHKKPIAASSAHVSKAKSAKSHGASLHGAPKNAAKSSSAHAHKKAPSGKSSSAYQSFVPVPQARPVPQVHEAIDPDAAVPAPDMAAEQQQPSYSKASPEAASALSVEDRLAHGSSALHFPAALTPFFQSLSAQAVSRDEHTVRVLQFGDSHTAADMFTGEMRSQMQARFGDGSVGFSYAGHPFAGYRILGSGRGQSGGWTTLGTHFTQLGDALLGMGGVAIEAQSAGSTASLSVNCSTLDVHYLRRQGGGSFNITDNGKPVQTVSTAMQPGTTQVDTASRPSGAAGSVTVPCQSGHNDFSFTLTGDGPVRLLGTVSLQPGITWDAIGINGAEAPLMMRWNRELFDTYLGSREPQLIVLAYGTNEAAARWTREEYQATFATLIDHLHAVAPESAILVLGPGDRAIAQSSYSSGSKGRRVRQRGYVPYTGTERILSAQREVCRTHNCAFWDWSARQGGFGSMQRWVAAGYAQPDHTHLTGTGYRALADALFADLLSSYDGFVKRGSVPR